MRRTLTIGLVLSAVLVSGCASLARLVDRKPAAGELQATAKHAAAVAVLTRDLVETEIAFHRAGRIPADQHRAFLTSTKLFTTAARSALETKNPALIQATIALAGELLTHAIAPIADLEVKAALEARLSAIRALLAASASAAAT